MNTRKHLEQWIDRFMAYVEGALPKDEIDQVEEHLKQCPACRVLLTNVQRVRERLQSQKGALRLSPEARVRLYERLNEERRKRGDTLLTIPQTLLEEVRRRALAATEAAIEAGSTGLKGAAQTAAAAQETAKIALEASKTVAKTAAEGAKRTAKPALEGMSEPVRTVVDLAKLAAEGAKDMMESAQETPPKGAVKAARAMAGKTAKAAGRVTKGLARSVQKGVQTGMEAAKGTARTAAQAAKGAAQVSQKGAATLHQALRSAAEVGETTVKGAKRVLRPEEDEEE